MVRLVGRRDPRSSRSSKADLLFINLMAAPSRPTPPFLTPGPTMTDTRSMTTYNELAVALEDSACRLVARKKRLRNHGNDGKARLGIPVESIPDPPIITPDVGDSTPNTIPASPPDIDDITPVIRALSQGIERLVEDMRRRGEPATTTTFEWKHDPDFAEASQAEHAHVGGYELIAYELPSGPDQDHLIGWELFTGPDLHELVGHGEAETFEQAKAAAEAVFRAQKT
jgi:hypothetical protein